MPNQSKGGRGRALLESKLQAADRDAFGTTIDEFPLIRADLVDTAEVVASEFQELTTAMATVAGEGRDDAELSAKRRSHYSFDVFTAALLLNQAQDALDGEHDRQSVGEEGEPADPDGRMAVVARRFVQTQLTNRDPRGITGGDRLPLAYFDAIVNYDPVAPAALAETVAAD